MLLDLEAKDMNQTLYALVEELNLAGLLEDELKGEVLRILLYKYVHIYILLISAVCLPSIQKKLL